ncbi:MAG TPA: hypothetical protein PLU72_14050 [Candidatus Ozemobacteraceae bacterium]|nr:hypothetical protein [Candidatus Ozemobacteraceae bacterium]
MKRLPRHAVTLVEILVGLGILAVIGTMLVSTLRSGRKEIQFSSDHLNAIILSQKVFEDLIEEMAMNPYGLETLGVEGTSPVPQEITDGRSVFFSYIEDRREPWGFIDPVADGSIGPQMKPLYDDIKKFKFGLSGNRIAPPGNGEDSNLVMCRLGFSWQTQTGKGEFESTCQLFSPAEEKKADLAAAVDEPALDARIPAEVYSRPGKTIPELATEIGENVETIRALGRIALLTQDFVDSEGFRRQKEKIAEAKQRLSLTPATSLDTQYEYRLTLARLWYDLAKRCFQVVAYLVPAFNELKQQGRFTAGTGSGFDPMALQGQLQSYRIIYEHFAGSLIQSRYYYYSLLESDLSQYKGGKRQLQTLQKLMDIYRVVAILPTRPQGAQEYRSFLERMKTLGRGRNPFLVRLVDQELVFVQSPSQWYDRLPNLKRIAAILQDQIPGILGFIREKSNAAVTGNSPASSTASTGS